MSNETEQPKPMRRLRIILLTLYTIGFALALLFHFTSRKEKGKMNNETEQPKPMSCLCIILFTLYFVALFFLLAHTLLELWPPPATPGAEAAPAVQSVRVLWGLLSLRITEEVRLILIVAVAGALGSYVHSATSFVTFAGNRRLFTSWTWWYLLRPLIGSALALIFYFAVRGAFFSLSANTQDLNVFGVAALGGMVGMFSKEATDKLHELFKDLFKVTEEVPRADKLEGKGK